MGGTEGGKGWHRDRGKHRVLMQSGAVWHSGAWWCSTTVPSTPGSSWASGFYGCGGAGGSSHPQVTCQALPPKSLHHLQVALALKALQRYRLGTDMSLFATDQFATDPNAAYPGYPTGSGIESTETYQSPPFTETSDTNPKGYQVPAY